MFKKFNYFIRSKNWFVLHYPLPIEMYNEANDEIKIGDYILMYGRMMAGKGEDVFLESLKILKDKGYKIRALICGPSPRKEYPDNLIKKLGLKDEVKYLGAVLGDELIRLIKNSMFVVVPSTYEESFGQTAIESMGLGKVVIASDIGGLGEVVNKHGILCKIKDPHDLAERMINLLLDKNKMKFLSENCKNYALKVFNPEYYIQKYLEIINK